MKNSYQKGNGKQYTKDWHPTKNKPLTSKDVFTWQN
jgi:hypothetical protein